MNKKTLCLISKAAFWVGNSCFSVTGRAIFKVNLQRDLNSIILRWSDEDIETGSWNEDKAAGDELFYQEHFITMLFWLGLCCTLLLGANWTSVKFIGLDISGPSLLLSLSKIVFKLLSRCYKYQLYFRQMLKISANIHTLSQQRPCPELSRLSTRSALELLLSSTYLPSYTAKKIWMPLIM